MKKIVTFNGCFDILHVAHIRCLQEAKKKGDVLIVLLNSDSSIKRLKGESRPIIPQEQRKEMLLALKCVDGVIIFYDDTPLKVLEIIRPDVHVKGGTCVEEKVKYEKELVESYGGELYILPKEEGFSTTNIINKIKDQTK